MNKQKERFGFALCADDYALSPGVSQGILDALQAGALTATSVMTTSPWWPESAGALAPYVDRADIGLHLNLTLGAPLGPMPEFAPTGLLPSLGQIALRMRSGQWPQQEIADEIDRQCDRFEIVFARAPDHLDGHQHVHMFAPVRRLVIAARARRGWRSWLRDSGDRPARILRRRITLTKALGLTALGHGFHGDASRNGVAINDGFAGFSSFRVDEDYQALFDRFLVAPGRHHLVMCHPGVIDNHLRRLDPVVETRERELAFLTSPRFGELLARRGASPVRLSTLLSAGAPGRADSPRADVDPV